MRLQSGVLPLIVKHTTPIIKVYMVQWIQLKNHKGPLRDMFEAVDHAKAYDYMFTLLGNKEITEKDILYLHKLFYRNIDEDFAGRYRDIPVFISGSNYPVTKVEDIQNEIEDLCKWIKIERKEYHPVEFAALLHKQFVFIHPFKDGNGRVAYI